MIGGTNSNANSGGALVELIKPITSIDNSTLYSLALTYVSSEGCYTNVSYYSAEPQLKEVAYTLPSPVYRKSVDSLAYPIQMVQSTPDVASSSLRTTKYIYNVSDPAEVKAIFEDCVTVDDAVQSMTVALYPKGGTSREVLQFDLGATYDADDGWTVTSPTSSTALTLYSSSPPGTVQIVGFSTSNVVLKD